MNNNRLKALQRFGAKTGFAGAIALLSTSAYADSNSLFTAGVGAAFGVTRSTGPGGTSPNLSGTPDLELRLRGLRALGLDFGFSPLASSEPNSSLIFDSKFRLSALIYLVPLDEFGLYLKAGIGALSPAELFTLTAPGNSYHAGLGFEIYAGDHFAFGGEFLMIVPGAMSVQRAILALSQKDSAALDTISVGDFVHPQNFRASLAFRYYL